MSPQDSHYNVRETLWNWILKEAWTRRSSWLYGSSGTSYSPQIWSSVSWNMCFVCNSDARRRCKCVHFHLYNLKTWHFFLPYYQQRKEQTRFNLSRGSGSWKHFTIREQVWYPSRSQDPERQCCQKKVKCCFICHSNSNFTSLLKLFWIVSFWLWLFLLVLLLPPFHLSPVIPHKPT